jgi:hypothetical protein
VSDEQSVCRSCGAPIVWARTQSGRLMPVDREPVDGGSLLLERVGGEYRVSVALNGGFRAHFATCPDAESWRHR